MRQLVVYTRPGCHLCAEAMHTLERLRPELGFALEEVDIERDDRLHARYLERIPVLVLDGEEIAEFFVDQDDLRRRLAG